MGRTRKRYNEKGRSNAGTPMVRGNEEKVEVVLSTEKERYDASNPLILSGSKKKAPSTRPKLQPQPKHLSKKQRKKLEKVLARKKKNVDRAELFEKLSQVQAKPEELSFFASTSAFQTCGLKRIGAELNGNKPKKMKINTIKGAGKGHSPNKGSSNAIQIKYESSSESSDSECDEKGEEDDENKKSSSEDEADYSKIEEQTSKSEENKIPEIEETKDTNPKSAVSANENQERKKDPSAAKPPSTPAVYVTVNRKPGIQAAREALPIFCEEQAVIEAIKENPVVLIHGETGSGKTTQVPQFLYEAGFTQNSKIIGITEPRRIAAMSMAARVGEELNAPEKVSYHIRYEKTVSKETEIKFMTDGVLLKELRHDFFLTKYSVIIVDEAHERSVFSDVLIGLLSRIISIRAKRKDPLKLIIMSATIRVEDFMENPRLFKVPPFFIRIGSRQHRVQVHFNIQTPDDYIDAAYRKVCKIHRQLPTGAILVFLTGEKEIQRLVKMFRETFPLKHIDEKQTDPESKENTESDTAVESPQAKQIKKKKAKDQSDAFCALPEINLDSYSIEPLDTENMEHHQSDDEGETSGGNFVAERFESASPLYALPLYSVLPFHDQEKIFKPPPEGSRLCVVATNVAETSITIPGLKYVVDTGKVKTKVYNSNNGGISKFDIVWCSKASANQRAGRCGRTEGGHCYRLYSSSVFEHDFPDFSLPEIQRIPVDDILLQMKSLGIDRVVEFPFPSPPEKEALMAAEKRLVWLGALHDLRSASSLQELKKWEYSAKVTPVGRAMSKFPVSPRFAKMLLLAVKHNCIQQVVAIVCALTVPQLFMLSATPQEDEDDGNEESKLTLEGMKKIGTGDGNSKRLGDVMVLLRAVAVFGESKNGVKFCRKFGIRYKAMSEIQKMYTQIVKELNLVFPESKSPVAMAMDPPDDEKVEVIRKIMAACLVDHVARKLSRDETKDEKSLKNAYKCLDCEDPVFIHPSSSQFERLPEFVVYNEIIETSKRYMKGVVEIEPEWLPAFSPSLCSFSAPLEDPPPTYDSSKDKIYCSMGGTFGRWQWEMPPISREMPTGFQKYSWFCFFFLDGQVFSSMKNYRADMLSTPSVMLKSWAKLLPRTRLLLQAVISKEVDSKQSLMEVWKKDPKYLFREVCEWLPAEKHFEIEMNWPPKK